MSDPRMPTVFTRARDIESLEGHVLAHVYEDLTGAPHMILEGTDGKVPLIRHTPAMEQTRAAGQLKPSSFASFERVENTLKIEDHGDAQAYLSSDRLGQTSKRLIRRDVLSAETEEYGGWLGDYRWALVNPHMSAPPNRTAPVGRGKLRTSGRSR